MTNSLNVVLFSLNGTINGIYNIINDINTTMNNINGIEQLCPTQDGLLVIIAIVIPIDFSEKFVIVHAMAIDVFTYTQRWQ